MKRVLITGKNSYVGTNVERWLMIEPDKYYVETISLRDPKWIDYDFSKFDVVFHVAGIAHKNESKYNKSLLYEINRDLVLKVSKKAKIDGVKHFIFLSSMSVYGLTKGIINNDTVILPKSIYGKSKHEAEELLSELKEDSFVVSIIRPPLVYGKGCKGNYPKLSNLAKKILIFPMIENMRSMIYIDNLSEFVRQLINKRNDGVFFPQNTDYVNTSEMVKLIAKENGKKIVMTRLFNPLIRILNIHILNKIFGDLVYDKSLSKFETNYNVFNFRESIMKSESL